MKYFAAILLLAGAVQAGQLKIRAERSYDAARKIVEIAEAKNKAAVRHQLLARAAPVLRNAELWSKQAAERGQDVAELRANLRELHARIARARSRFVASRDSKPVIPNTGTVIVVTTEPDVEVAGTSGNRVRVERRRELNGWRLRRTLARVGTFAIAKQQVRLTRAQTLRKAQLEGPKNIDRLERRAKLNAWRLARVESRCPIR